MNIYIKEQAIYFNFVKYVLLLIEKNVSNKFVFLADKNGADLIWDNDDINSEPVSIEFYNALFNDISSIHNRFIENNLCVLDSREKKDIIATIFYMTNCIQELARENVSVDDINRFQFKNSYQYKFGNIEENLVQKEVDDFCTLNHIKKNDVKSRFFISHDIDSIYGSFFQDGFWALKRFRFDIVLKLIFFELLRKPHWKNIDQIMKINNEYDIKSTFFWLVNKGIGSDNIENADYNLSNELKLTESIVKSNFTLGLHKSCSDMSINDELKKGNLNTTFNRYHFLRFSVENDWKNISDSKLNFDSSLGFAERYGFRNSYGKAFQPFDFKNQVPYDFIEAPLHFMDGTFHKYMNIRTSNISSIVIKFYEDNAVNCDFSLLWHNTYFTNYKYQHFVTEYKKILEYIYENKINVISPYQLVNENRLIW